MNFSHTIQFTNFTTYNTAKTSNEIFIVLETAAVAMLWAVAEYRRNSLTVSVCGPLGDDMTCWCNYERPHVIPNAFASPVFLM